MDYKKEEKSMSEDKKIEEQAGEQPAIGPARIGAFPKPPPCAEKAVKDMQKRYEADAKEIQTDLKKIDKYCGLIMKVLLRYNQALTVNRAASHLSSFYDYVVFGLHSAGFKPVTPKKKEKK